MSPNPSLSSSTGTDRGRYFRLGGNKIPGASFAWLWALPPLLTGLLIMGWLLALALSLERWQAYSWTIDLAQWPVFSDLGVLQEGIRLHAQGIDPLAAEPLAHEFCYNYPRLWLGLSSLGVHNYPLPWMGFALGVTWVVTLVALLPIRSAGLAVIMVLALLSAPVTLALERGNIDLGLFILCMFAVWAWQRVNIPWVTPALIALGSLLKLYPGAAFVLIFVDIKNRRQRLWWLASAVLVFLYWISHLPELGLIAARTPRVTGASFGCAVVPMRYSHYLENIFPHPFPLTTVLIIALLLFVAWVGVSAWAGFRMAPSFVRVPVPREELSAFLVMATIWIGAFALGNNFAYRLVLILPCLPLLWRLCVTPGIALGLWQWATVTLSTVVVIFFAPLNTYGRTFVFVQAASWLMTGALVAGCCGLAKAAWISRSAPAQPSPAQPSHV